MHVTARISSTWKSKAVSVYLLGIVATFVLTLGPAPAFGQKRKEATVKVAYLYKFTRFVAWPDSAFDSPTSPFFIGVVGKDPFEGLLGKLTERKVGKHPIKIVVFPDVSAYKDCHMLFVTAQESHALDAVKKVVTQQPTLVVGDASGFAKSGGGAEFYPDRNGTIGIRINLDAVKANDLKLDAKLMKVADVIREK